MIISNLAHRQDEIRRTSTRCAYVYQIGLLFRFFQEEADVCALLASRSNSTTAAAAAAASNQVDQHQQPGISTLPELREFFLQPLIKAKLRQYAREKMALSGIKLVLPSLGLHMTADFATVSIEADCEGQAPVFKLLLPRCPPLSHAPSLSVAIQKFIIDIFNNDTSRTKHTNTNYLSALSYIWRMLEQELVGTAAAPSSSSFPLIPPLATPEDLRAAFLENSNLKDCFLDLHKTGRRDVAAKRVLLEALGLEMSRRKNNGMLDIVVKKKDSTKEKRRGRLLQVQDDEEDQGPAKTARIDAIGSDTDTGAGGMTAATMQSSVVVGG